MTTYSQINATWPTPLPLVTSHEGANPSQERRGPLLGRAETY